MNVITEWMEGWGVLIEVKIKGSYTVSLYEEVTPLPKSHDSNDVIMLDGISLGQALSVFWDKRNSLLCKQLFYAILCTFI